MLQRQLSAIRAISVDSLGGHFWRGFSKACVVAGIAVVIVVKADVVVVLIDGEGRGEIDGVVVITLIDEEIAGIVIVVLLTMLEV